MKKFNPSELAKMQSTQESAMQDSCIISAFGEIQDASGQVIRDWTDRAEQDCGFNPTTGREIMLTDMTVVKAEAVVRLPVDTVIDMRDRIKITRRYGVTVPVEVFEIVAPVRRGPSGILLDLRRLVV